MWEFAHDGFVFVPCHILPRQCFFFFFALTGVSGFTWRVRLSGWLMAAAAEPRGRTAVAASSSSSLQMRPEPGWVGEDEEEKGREMLNDGSGTPEKKTKIKKRRRDVQRCPGR